MIEGSLVNKEFAIPIVAHEFPQRKFYSHSPPYVDFASSRYFRQLDEGITKTARLSKTLFTRERNAAMLPPLFPL